MVRIFQLVHKGGEGSEYLSNKDAVASLSCTTSIRKRKKAFTGADCFFNPILTYSHWNNLLNWFCTCSNKYYYTYTNNLYHLFNYDWPCPHSSQSFASQMFFVFWSGAFRMYFLSSVSMAKTCSFVPTLAFGRMPTNFERSMVWRFSFLLASL